MKYPTIKIVWKPFSFRFHLIRDFLWLLWTKGSNPASCLMISLDGYLTPKDRRQMRDYMIEVVKIDERK